MSERTDPVTVALVLAGGGARGAYEVGVLSVLLPVLEERGERPRIVIGTSVGAVNTGFLAANAHLPVSKVIPEALMIWESIRWREVARHLISGGSLLRLSEYAGEVLRVPGARLESLLDPEPCARRCANESTSVKSSATCKLERWTRPALSQLPP